mgnify:CR=1 FL=1
MPLHFDPIRQWWCNSDELMDGYGTQQDYLYVLIITSTHMVLKIFIINTRASTISITSLMIYCPIFQENRITQKFPIMLLFMTNPMWTPTRHMFPTSMYVIIVHMQWSIPTVSMLHRLPSKRGRYYTSIGSNCVNLALTTTCSIASNCENVLPILHHHIDQHTRKHFLCLPFVWLHSNTFPKVAKYGSIMTCFNLGEYGLLSYLFIIWPSEEPL